jgi:hypothetical protein
MKSPEKSRKNNDLNLENDLLLSTEDFAFMKKNLLQKDQDLESYLNFLDEIGAFESKKIKLKFYDAEFEL